MASYVLAKQTNKYIIKDLGCPVVVASGAASSERCFCLVGLFSRLFCIPLLVYLDPYVYRWIFQYIKTNRSPPDAWNYFSVKHNLN
jgi:hypothetical protein